MAGSRGVPLVLSATVAVATMGMTLSRYLHHFPVMVRHLDIGALTALLLRRTGTMMMAQEVV